MDEVDIYKFGRYEVDDYDIFMEDCLEIVSKKVESVHAILSTIETDIEKLMSLAQQKASDRLCNNEVTYRDNPCELPREYWVNSVRPDCI
jgi:hypothetical protein